MRVVLQRVSGAEVTVTGSTVGKISQGVLLLVGFGKGDSSAVLPKAVDKIVGLRIFPDDRGRFHHSLLDIQGEVLLVSQFTLYASTVDGRRPSFSDSLPPEEASQLFDEFVSLFRQSGVSRVETGQFGAYMKVALENDGPVTLVLEFSP